MTATSCLSEEKGVLSATMRLIWGDSDPPFKQGWPVNLVFPGCIQTTTIPFSFKQQQFCFHSNNNNWLHSKNTHIYMWRSYSERRASGSLHGRVVAKMFRSPFLRVMALWTCDISPTTILTFICILPCNWSIRILRTSRNSFSSENVPIVTIDCNL